MELVPLTRDRYRLWDDFCLKSPNAWFWHTTSWLDYNFAYHRGLCPEKMSFLCLERGKVAAVVPLMLTHHEDGSRRWKAFSLSSLPLPAPAVDGDLPPAERDDVLDLIFSAIDDMAEELGVSHIRFQIDALRPASLKPLYPPYNFLLRHDYIDCSISTQMIDLRLTRSELRNGLRRNHLRSIEKGRELFQIKIHSGKELSDEKFEQYAQMHARAAGRVTRPKETFDLMRRQIQSGEGCMVEALTSERRPAGFELYVIFKNGSYGLSACNEPEYKYLPIRHLIEWEAMMWLRGRGVEFYDIGPQHFGILPYDFPEKKNEDISHFKYGFGGATVPFFHAEKFYSEEHWRAERRQRDARFADRYPWRSENRTDKGRDLLRKMREPSRPAEPTAPPERVLEALEIPESFALLARKIAVENPDAVRRYASGNQKVLNFLVGKALLAKPDIRDGALLRRALERFLSQPVADGRKAV